MSENRYERESLLSLFEASGRFHVSVKRLKQAAANRELPHYKLDRREIRFKAADIEAFIESKRVPCKEAA